MQRAELFTAAVLAAMVPIAACNYASSQRDTRDSRSTIPAGDSAVATTGTLPAGGVLDDASVTSRIQAKFFLDPGIKVRRIDVDTQRGIVTLRGDVASDNERAQALILARTTEGVERVEDALTVNAAIDAPAQADIADADRADADKADTAASGDLPAPSSADDETLTAALQSRFSDDTSLKAATIAVTAKDGVVLLDGVAPTVAAKQRLIAIARDTAGVVQVIDRITVQR
jgi:osmotically-inducible protein OsmY